QLADAAQVAAADLVADEGVGRVEHRGVVAPGGLQRLEPGVHVLGREFGFKAFEAAGPDIHHFGFCTMTAPRRASGSGRTTVAVTREQADYHRPREGASPTGAATRGGPPSGRAGRAPWPLLDRPNHRPVQSPVLSDA